MLRHRIFDRLALALAFTFLLSAIAAPAFAHRPRDRASLPASFHLLPFSGICADSEYLYVMAGGKIMQYRLADMTLLKELELPEPPAPSGIPFERAEAGQLPPFPPPKAAPHGLWAGNGSLYVLAGPAVHVYAIPDLTLKSTTELPKPDLTELGQ